MSSYIMQILHMPQINYLEELSCNLSEHSTYNIEKNELSLWNTLLIDSYSTFMRTSLTIKNI